MSGSSLGDAKLPERKSVAWVVGYAAFAQLYVEPGLNNPIEPWAVENPFKEGTECHQGFEDAYASFFTRK
jgi:hypothetical protein